MLTATSSLIGGTFKSRNLWVGPWLSPLNAWFVVAWLMTSLFPGAVFDSPVFQKDPEGDIEEFLLESLTTEEGVSYHIHFI